MDMMDCRWMRWRRVAFILNWNDSWQQQRGEQIDKLTAVTLLLGCFNRGKSDYYWPECHWVICWQLPATMTWREEKHMCTLCSYFKLHKGRFPLKGQWLGFHPSVSLCIFQCNINVNWRVCIKGIVRVLFPIVITDLFGEVESRSIPDAQLCTAVYGVHMQSKS